MIAYNTRARGYLAAGVLLVLSFGLHFLARRSRVPYGHDLAPYLVLGSLAMAVGLAGLWIRQTRLRSLLTRARPFDLPSDKIPLRDDATYIGRGFAWTPIHARRLGELALADLHLGEDARDRFGGNWLIHGIGADGYRDLFLPNPLLTQHLFALGAPGSGKTRFLELLIEQAVRRGDAVVVIDPKGDERLLDRTYDSAIRTGRAEDFRFFGLPYPYQSARYNPLAHYVRPNEITDRIALVLPRGGGDAEAFRNFAWDFVNTVTTALNILEERISVAALQNYCLHNTWLLARKLIKHYCPKIDTSGDLNLALDKYRGFCAERGRGILELDQLIKMAKMDPPYFDKMASALRPVFSKLMSPTVGYLLCPGEVPIPSKARPAGPVPELSWASIDRDRLVVYFFLGSMIGAETASGVARMALADLQSYLGKKYAYDRAADYGRVTVIVDEAGDVLAPETVNILNKARGAELSLCLAGQSIADLDVALGGPAGSRRALANIGTFIVLRTPNPDDSDYFSDKCGLRPIEVVSQSETYEPAVLSSGRTNIDDFAFRATRSTTTREQPLVPGYVLGQLPRFHYFAQYSGEVYKAVLPFLDPPRELYSVRLKGADL